MKQTNHMQKLMALIALGATSMICSTASAGGFELGENTTQAVSRGGTGAVLKRDPTAMYFNPALLPRAKGYQLTLNLNMVDMNVTFDRDPFDYTLGRRERTRTFTDAENQSGFFPAPFLATSWDLGIKDFALGIGVFGPSAYTGLCYGEKQDDGTCKVDPENGARHMMVSSELLQIYFTLGAGYRFKVGSGTLSVGASVMAAYQNTSFTLVVDEAEAPISPPWEENPEKAALFEAQDLQGWRPTGVLGIAYQLGGFHLAASYRLPISWESKGKVKVNLPDSLAKDAGAQLTDDGITLRTQQAGSLRLGAAWTEGTHPGFADRPRLELEANLVWEDWSRVEVFEVETAGDIELTELDIAPIELPTIYQEKRWQDTWSLRLGGSYGATSWLTAHAGVAMETATQSRAYTNADFPAWERYTLSTGGTFHVTKWLDLDIGYMFIRSPDRTVTDGKVYQSIPLSECRGPDYTSDKCETKGQPPGSPQNKGKWTFWSQIASVGLTVHLD